MTEHLAGAHFIKQGTAVGIAALLCQSTANSLAVKREAMMECKHICLPSCHWESLEKGCFMQEGREPDKELRGWMNLLKSRGREPRVQPRMPSRAGPKKSLQRKRLVWELLLLPPCSPSVQASRQGLRQPLVLGDRGTGLK